MRITVSIAALASLIALAAFGPASAGASVGADLRVVGPSGQLDDLTQYSDTTTMPTSPQAECFGAGSGVVGFGHRRQQPADIDDLGIAAQQLGVEPR